jgi:hypothetical protein
LVILINEIKINFYKNKIFDISKKYNIDFDLYKNISEKDVELFIHSFVVETN